MRARSCLVATAVAAFLAACGLATSGEAPGNGDGGGGLNDGASAEGASSSSSGSSSGSSGSSGSGGDAAGEGDSTSPGNEGGGQDQSAPEAPGVDVGPTETGPTCGTGCYTIPSGWSLVAFAPSQGTMCPGGFAGAGATNLVEGPITTNACECAACQIGTQPTCAAGSIPSDYDFKGVGPMNCGSTGNTLTNNPAGVCDTGGLATTGINYSALDLKFVAPLASGGACTSAGQATGSLSYTGNDTECTPDSPSSAGCNGDECTPNLMAPYQACVVQSGDVPCPTSVFTVQHLVGTSTTLTCGACGCNVSATCGGRVALFTDGSCMDNEFDVGADSNCHAGPGGTNTNFGSYKYIANAPGNVACTPSGSSTPQDVTLANEQTICCTQ
jgi:hypothetical protein